MTEAAGRSPDDEPVSVTITVIGRPQRALPATAHRKRLTGGARLARGLSGLGACWSLAVVSVLIPVAHFVLVPAFALAGPVVAWLRYRPRSLVLAVAGSCPECAARLDVKPQSEEWPLATYCDACLEPVEIAPS